jgi:hypothetical protein
LWWNSIHYDEYLIARPAAVAHINPIDGIDTGQSRQRLADPP